MNAISKLPFPRNKTIKIVFTLVNIVIALLQVFHTYTAGEALLGAIIVTIFSAIVLRSDASTPASAYLCHFFLMQCLVWCFASHGDGLNVAYDKTMIGVMLAATKGTKYHMYLFVVGGILALFGWLKVRFTWLTGVGCGLFGLAFLLPLYFGKDLQALILFRDANAYLVLAYLLLVAYWSVSLQVVSTVCPAMRTRCIVFGIVLVGGLVYIGTDFISHVKAIVPSIRDGLLGLPNGALSWPRVVIAVVLLVALYLSITDNHKAYDADSAVLLLSASTLLIIRLLMSNYFVYNWVFFFVYLVLALAGLKKLETERNVFGLCAWQFYVVLFVAAVPVLLMLCWGLWINALIAVAFGFFVISKRVEMQADSSGTFLCVSIITFMVAEAFARLATWRLSLDGCILLGIVYASAMVVVYIINRKHPTGINPKTRYHAIVALCVGLLCLASLKSPTKIDAVTEVNDAHLSVAAVNDSNSIFSSYMWSDYMGRTVVEKTPFVGKADLKLPIQSDVLTITTVDSHGVTCRRKFYYAPWVHSFTPPQEVTAQ